MRRLILQSFTLLASIVFVVSASAAGNLDPQTSSQSGVTVKVTPRSLAGAEWEFSIAFDTHSQDLSDDLVKSAVLIADGGQRLVPSAWQGDPPGGHHRKGVLRFAAVTPAPTTIELHIQRQGEPAPRVLRWQLR